MKFIRPFLVFLFFAALATVLLSLVLPTRQKLERSVTIHASPSQVYAQLAFLRNFNAWSVWTAGDTTAFYSIEGNDGTPGALSRWKGDLRISGEGNMEITALEQDRKVVHSIHFLRPAKRLAHSTFTIAERNGSTVLTWKFEMSTPRPWNIFNLFYSMEKERGAEFEAGLAALKKKLEGSGNHPAENKYEPRPVNFPATRFALVRQKIKWSDMALFYQQHLGFLRDKASLAAIEPRSSWGIIYDWDEKRQEADMAAAIEVPGNAMIDNVIVSMVNIPGSKAVFADYVGAYENASDVYAGIREYMAKKGLKPKPGMIQQLIIGPAAETDTAKWRSRVFFLVE